MVGQVVRHQRTTVTKRVVEGVGDNKTERIVEEEVYVLVVLGPDGSRVRLQKGKAWDAVVGENVTLELRYGMQKKIDGGDD